MPSRSHRGPTRKRSRYGDSVEQERNGDLPSALATIRPRFSIPITASSIRGRERDRFNPPCSSFRNTKSTTTRPSERSGRRRARKLRSSSSSAPLAHIDAYLEQAEPAKERWVENARGMRGGALASSHRPAASEKSKQRDPSAPESPSSRLSVRSSAGPSVGGPGVLSEIPMPSSRMSLAPE